jgi:hypothetical protein
MNVKQGFEQKSPSPRQRRSMSRPRRWWRAWVRLTAPADPAPGASFYQIQAAQRGRMVSLMLLLSTGPVLLGLLMSIVSVHLGLVLLTAALLLGILILSVLNRHGQVTLVGIILWTAVSLGMGLALLSSGVLSPAVLPLLSMLVLSEGLAALVLPLPFVLLAALCNTVSALLAFVFLPHSSLLEAVLAPSDALITGWNVALYGLVALGLWLLVKNRERMNQASEVARLQHALQRERQGHERLIAMLERTEQILQRALKGGQFARMELPSLQDPVLGSLSLTLSQMLDRMHRLARVQASHQAMLPLMTDLEQVEARQQALRQDVARVLRALRVASERQQPIQLGAPTLEELEPLFHALHQQYVLPPPQAR